MGDHIDSKVDVDRFGDFVVLAYHDVQDASSLHEQFKRRSIDAAVIDSAFVLSRLHLAVALHRIAQRPLSLDSAAPRSFSAAPRQRARDVFVALSHMRNLDRVLQQLTAAETTRAVVIVLSSPTVEHIAEVMNSVHGTRHDLRALGAYSDAALTADFYGLSRCDGAALEASVVNRLATNDC